MLGLLFSFILLIESFFIEDIFILSLSDNKNLGRPSFFFSLYTTILEQIPIKFLNKVISFISILFFVFFSFSDSIIDIGGNSTLFIPTYISQLMIVFFLLVLNLIKTQFISFSFNLINGSLEVGDVN